MINDEKMLEVRDLSIQYLVGDKVGSAVEEASFEIKKGEVFGIAGESGCGKSTLAWSILKLLPSNARIVNGEIIFEGKNLLELSEKVMNKEIRGKKATIIIQNVKDSFNPVFTIGAQMSDLLRFHAKDDQGRQRSLIYMLTLLQRAKKKNERRLRCIEMLEEMEIAAADRRFLAYPHQFSGGMKQRAMMAMNFITNPSLIIADEPTTALDVSVEAYILDIFKDKTSKYRTSVLYITHNLRILSEIANRVSIMYAGKIVEQAPAKELFSNPLHPYTTALIECLPEKGIFGKELQEIPGRVPSIFARPKNCTFQPRCPISSSICRECPPPNKTVSPNHFVLCHNVSGAKGHGFA